MPNRKPSRRPQIGPQEYARLASFRYALRSFLRFSEQAAERVGLTAQHYQAMLAVRGWATQQRMSINDLAQQLLVKHNSAVGLVDRLHKQGLMAREPSSADRRVVLLRLTVKGDRLLARLAETHREELERVGPELKALLRQVTRRRDTV